MVCVGSNKRPLWFPSRLYTHTHACTNTHTTAISREVHTHKFFSNQPKAFLLLGLGGVSWVYGPCCHKTPGASRLKWYQYQQRCSTAYGGRSPPFPPPKKEHFIAGKKGKTGLALWRWEKKHHYLFCLSFSAEFRCVGECRCRSRRLQMRFQTCLSTSCCPHASSFPCEDIGAAMASCLGGMPWHPSVSDRPKQQSWVMKNLPSEGIRRSNHLQLKLIFFVQMITSHHSLLP